VQFWRLCLTPLRGTIIGVSGVDLTAANFYTPLPHLYATYSLAATITDSYAAPSALLSIGRPSLPDQKHHQLYFSFFVLSNVHQTLTGEALLPARSSEIFTHHNQTNIGISWICRCLFRATFVKRSLESCSHHISSRFPL